MRKAIYYILFGDYELSLQIPVIGNLIAIITALSICTLVSGFLFMIPGKSLFYISACALSLMYIISHGYINLNKQMLLFYGIILLNVLILPIDSMFRSQERALYFIFITLVCSPVIKSYIGVAYRECLFKYIIIGFSILTILSFFCFFIGINMMPFNRVGSMELYNNYKNVGGKFSGLFNHSMIYGPVAAIVSLIHFNLYLKYKKTIRLILFFICSISCCFSASRAALLALIIGIISIMYKACFTRNSYISFDKIIYIIFFIGISIISFSDVAFSGLSNKIEITKKQTGGYSSRNKKYERRLYEFSESPIMGVGFASIDISTGDAYNPANGQIEPGTSHLAVLAQTGLVGMIAYIILLYGAIKVLKNRTTLNAFIAYSLLWCFLGHGCAEGWIFAPGGMICFMFWLSLSQCYDLEVKEERI